jgi:uncharacterized membrane protein YbjE (DUF340 family)
MSSIPSIFVITAIWDIILRLLAEEKLKVFGLERIKPIQIFREYFETWGVVSSAIIAGLIGAFTAYLVESIISDSKFIIILLMSGFVGILMRNSGQFEVLRRTYYDKVSTLYSFTLDASSGAIVASTYAFLRYARVRWI